MKNKLSFRQAQISRKMAQFQSSLTEIGMQEHVVVGSKMICFEVSTLVLIRQVLKNSVEIVKQPYLLVQESSLRKFSNFSRDLSC